MKTIGLIGGLSWESTSTYYSLINRGVNARLGGNHSAKILMYSFDFQEIEELQYAGKWDELKDRIDEAGRALKRAGADGVVLCTNTMHKVVGSFDFDVGLPLLHIADAVGEEISNRGISKVGLLGTIFTMEQDFYKDRLAQKYGLSVLVPEKRDRETVNRVIYGELVKGIINDSSRAEYLSVMDKLRSAGAGAIILGCTEIGLLVKEHACELFDSTVIHARKAVDFCLSE